MAFDVITPVRMGGSEAATLPALTTIRTTPSNSKDLIKEIAIANTNGSAVTVIVYLVPSGDVPAVGNTLIPSVSVPANGIFQWNGIQVIDDGSTIQAGASTSGVSVTVSGGNGI